MTAEVVSRSDDQGRAAPSPGRAVLVDAHVHLHDCFSDEEFLDAADRNVRAAFRTLDLAEEPLGCLCFTECAGVYEFPRLASNAPCRLGEWAIERTSESRSLLVQRAGTYRLVLIAGRQVVTSEGLELSAIGTDVAVADGMSLVDTVNQIIELGAVAVAPWGFGKWWFNRGSLLREFIDRFDGGPFFLGDSSVRPNFARWPREFDQATRRGRWILPGTDPLPLPSEVRKIASYGFVLPRGLDMARPRTSLVENLRNLTAQPAIYGRLEGLPRFVHNQLVMNLRKHLSR